MTNQLSPHEVTVGDAVRAHAQGAVQILDVRELDEWQEGHIPGAIHVPLGELPARIVELDSVQPVIVVCRSGRRSLDGAGTLTTAGFLDAKSLAGGMLEWADGGHPVESS